MIVLLESLLSENVIYFLVWKLTEVPIFFVSDADKVFEFWTKSYKYVFWENIWLCNNNTTWQKSIARITLVTEKSTQDFSDLDLSIDIKYLSCRLYDFDLRHLIMNCWKPDTRHTSLECFHSSQFASSMTLQEHENNMFSQSKERSDRSWPIRGLETAKIGQCLHSEWVWNTFKTCFVAAWIHIVTIYWILNRYQLPWTRTRRTKLKNIVSICQQKYSEI